jgi:hypothetical protein
MMAPIANPSELFRRMLSQIWGMYLTKLMTSLTLEAKYSQSSHSSLPAQTAIAALIVPTTMPASVANPSRVGVRGVLGSPKANLPLPSPPTGNDGGDRGKSRWRSWYLSSFGCRKRRRR